MRTMIDVELHMLIIIFIQADLFIHRELSFIDRKLFTVFLYNIHM